MRKAVEYRQHAAQCRALARAVDGEHGRQLLQMATDWDALAAERTALIERYPELSCSDDTDDDDPVSLTA